MNTVEAINHSLHLLRRQIRRERSAIIPTGTGRAAHARVEAALLETIQIMEALRDLLKVSTELGTADAAAIRQSMKEDLVR
jgi:hypothetical protein